MSDHTDRDPFGLNLKSTWPAFVLIVGGTLAVFVLSILLSQ